MQISDWGMFTVAGNVAVGHIVENVSKKYETKHESFHAIVAELEKLQCVSCFAEATDTEVRERIWKHHSDIFPEIVFRSSRMPR